ncbi:MAG: hypothetical protein EZS28_041574 [Streblomastix strix]|uniref:Uncharacterized protein n=1 Tax=Streblomastix strix TaxID=222440 RepID=A0A5J4TYC1_9EUKA|nr:MAG: hypothetical protein EZS28_041574 [Streblomastix strix]
MQSNQDVNGIVRVIIRFTDSDTKNKQEKQNEQQESESTLSLAQVTSSLEYLWKQIQDKQSCKQVIRVPKLLQSLIALATFRLGTHLREQTDLLRLKVRHLSRWCLWLIYHNGDEQIKSELVINEYGRVMTLSFCTAGGIGEEEDEEIFNGLRYIYWFLRILYQIRNDDYDYDDDDDDWQPSFHPLPLLARNTEEQIEEDGANEEIEAQINNNGLGGDINSDANEAKATILNHFINQD